MLLFQSIPQHGNHRLLWDVIYIAVFSAGQALFMLKRADLARRSPLNGVKTIRQFMALNWVTLLFRAVIEWGVFLWPYRSASASFIQTAIEKVGVNFPFQVPTHRGLAGAFFLGVAADLLVDWILMQKWIQSVPLLNKLAENIPQLPEVTQIVDSLAASKESKNN